MIEIGICYTCQMIEIQSDGLLLKVVGSDEDELMAKPDLSILFQKGKEIKVFSWFRGEDGRNWASLKIPEIQLDEVAFLRVASETKFGFFMDWGMEKDLFCPLSHVLGEPKPEMIVPVRMMLDEATNRLMCSMKWKKQTDLATDEFYRSQEVDVQVMEPTDLGFVVLVNSFYLGMIYENQTFKSFRIGQKIKAFVNKVREDGKLDILLQRPGYGEVMDVTDELMEAIVKAGGKLKLGDKSPAEDIYSELKMSKKTFKKAVGALYRTGRIGISDVAIWKLEEDKGD